MQCGAVRCNAVRVCEGSTGCASIVDYSESTVGTLLLLVRVVVGGVAGAQKLVRGVACRRTCCS